MLNRSRRVFGPFFTVTLSLFVAACKHHKPQASKTASVADSDTTEALPSDVDIPDLINQDAADGRGALPSEAPEPSPSSLNARIERLPKAIQADATLARLVAPLPLEHPELMDQGVYGKIGAATFYVTTTDRIDNWGRLYWVMVRVLSQKYGCFMKNKQTTRRTVRFGCRDGRAVMFWRWRGKGWIAFYGRQYDRAGRELKVANHKLLNRRRVTRPGPEIAIGQP